MATIGVDIGGTNVRIALVDGRKVIGRETLATGEYPDPDSLLAEIAGQVNAFARANEVIAVGIAIPGEVDADGRVHRFPNIPSFNAYPMQEKLVGLVTGQWPIAIDNDANAAALAEARWGAAKPFSNFLHITLGTGVGGGLVLDGNVVRGRDGFAGEIGHVFVGGDAECTCGARGCVEADVGAAGILRELASHGVHVSNVLKAYEKAMAGDQSTLSAFSITGKRLGIALASILNTLNLEAVTIGGGIAPAFEFMRESVAEELVFRCMGKVAARIPLLQSTLGEDCGILGASLLPDLEN